MEKPKKEKKWHQVGQSVEKRVSWREIQDSEEWKSAKDEPTERRTIKGLWVKRLLTNREYNGHYKYYSCYYKFGDVDYLGKKRVKIGFLVVGVLPPDCEELTDEELREVDNYRKSYHIYPTPFLLEETMSLSIKP